MDIEPSIEFPERLNFLFEPARYKVAYGGRGGAKSWSFARALLILAVQKKLKILCAREYQNSISESVHTLLSEQIENMNLINEFEITNNNIKSIRTGSEFIFIGLKYNVTKIKSMEGLDIIWLEEAHAISNASWDIVIPTMRGRSNDDPKGIGGPFNKGPEVWCSFNPSLEDDPTYRRFILNPPNKFDSKGNRYCYVEKVDWRDNPWFPDILKEEMNQLKLKDENAWLHVWEGHTKQTLDGAIFGSEIKQVLLDKRRGKVPYDSSRPVHTFWDLGHSDHTAIWFIQQVGMEYNIINYYQDHLKKIGFYLEYLQSLNYVYGKHYMPHDADNETLANISIASIARKVYPKNIIVVPKIAKKVIGINAARTVFDLCNFDEENTIDGWQCLCRYQYAINEETGNFSKEPLHNEYSHGADAFLCFAQSLKSETASKKKVVTVSSGRIIPLRNQSSWMR